MTDTTDVQNHLALFHDVDFEGFMKGRTKATADTPAGSKMVTVARWRGEAICEEYIWGG